MNSPEPYRPSSSRPASVTAADVQRWKAQLIDLARQNAKVAAAVSVAGAAFAEDYYAATWLREQLVTEGCDDVRREAILTVVQQTVYCGTDMWALVGAALDQYRLGHWPLTADELAASVGQRNFCMKAGETNA